jgi:hypothetical protein
MKTVVLAVHKSNYPNPITFSKGENLGLGKLDTEYPGWIRTTTQCGNVGWAPVDYIEISSCGTKGVALCDYDAFELDTFVGESVEVITELNSWLLVINQSGTQGWIPKDSVATP